MRRRAATRALHIGVAPPRRAPPFGAVALPPPPVPLTERLDLRGAIDGGQFVSPWLALTSAIPRGFNANTKKPGVQLIMTRAAPSLAVATFGFVPWEAESGERAVRTAHAAFIEGMAATTGKNERPIQVSAGPVATPFGAGTQMTWRLTLSTGEVSVRSIIAGGCDGAVIWQWGFVWAADDGERTLDDWLRSFEPTAARSPACEAIHGEDAPEAI